ncbi:hypothetical protein PDIDSM_4234 [Penicillium digitatum]|nr:hypothetical protein PDIDSM_4234 [Penicillium digitatum]
MSGPPFTVRSVFEYASGHDDDLNFPIGQIMTVTALEDDDWYYGEYSDAQGVKQEGIFPKNFVERYEPPAPPRPSRPRSRKETEPVPVESPVVEIKQPEPEPEPVVQPTEEDYEIASPQPPLPQSPPLRASAPVVEVVSSPPKPTKAPAPAPVAPVEPAAKALSKPAPPAVAGKPSGSSFRDRIAAFNKPAAAPVTPFKPGGSQPFFIKKPFVARPPSRDAYKPPPREPAPKVYKREEDPDVKEQNAREPPVSESRLAPIEGGEEGAEDQPKPTSLKERIALLQKQQLEQAQRHAEAAQKKEKPSRPPKKSMDEPVAPAVLDEEQESPRPVEEFSAARDASVDTLRAAAPLPQAAVPFSPTQEIASDANDADYSAAADSEDTGETSTSKDDEDKQPQSRPVSQRQQLTRALEQTAEADVEDESDAEEEEELDPETKRRMELRERMAKMSGGMGMMGLFGPPSGGMPGMSGLGSARKTKTSGDSEKRLGEVEHEPTSPANAPPVPMIPLPGMNVASKPAPSTEVEKEEEDPSATPLTEKHSACEVPDVEEVIHEGLPPRASIDHPAPAPPSQDRSAPPPPPRESRPVPTVPSEPPASPPPVPAGRSAPSLSRPTTADKGEESDDELSVHTSVLSLNTSAAPPAVPAPAIPAQIDSRRSSTYDTVAPTFPTPAAEKRASRLPPPIPVNPPMPPSSQGRAPPPPPPDQLRRGSTADSRTTTLAAPRQAGEEVEGEVTEYDGDYDTDIASGEKHKDALKAHERDSSFDEGIIAEDQSIQSPYSPQESRHPPPPPTAPRAVPPPPPSQPPRNARASIDTPRGPPPPPPPNREPASDDDDDDDDDVEYDPFNYSAPQHGVPTSPPLPLGRPEAPPFPPPQAANEYDDLYDAPPLQSPVKERPSALNEKRLSLAHVPPQSQSSGLPSPSATRTQRASMDILRNQPNLRRSMDVSRPSIDQGYIATDVDFATYSLWWTKPNTPPPAFQNRTDLLFEVEETASTNRSGKTTVSKDVYILFIDYSQTVLNVQFDPKSPTEASFEQRHEPPPPPLRQDQLEQAHIQLGTRISEAVNSVQNSTVGDGTPFGLVQYLLNPLSDALLPVGTRGYGASVYSNLANASVFQNDEIRAGDIVSFRNARFQGHRGTMHQKYSADVGKPDHVGIVVDWDGTKKKIRAWEQGRESKKVKMESFKLNDLRSGECKVWRVMPRSWVGWEASK